MPHATHSAEEKCPGNAGTIFMRKSSNETAIPSPVTRRMDARFSTNQKERHAANHPSAEAIEPTSVTGTSSASPRKSPSSVPAVIPSTATEGVRNRSEEHTSELQSRLHLVCRLLLEKKKKRRTTQLLCAESHSS